LKGELYQLNVSKVTGSNAANLLNILQLRKGVARVLTVMTEKTRANVRKLYEGKRLKPLDLRTKGTRAWRRRLLPRHLASKLAKTIKRENNFPKRTYALRV
jgi:large subunit ribosomal protein L35e